MVFTSRPPKRSSSLAHRLERLRQQVAPARVAETGRDLGRADDVGEEERYQHAVVRGADARPVAQAAPLDLHDRLVADRVAVVPRRDVEDVTGAEDDRRAVGELDAETARDDEADVPDLAPLPTDGRPDVLSTSAIQAG